jgi:hypothetical protein
MALQKPGTTWENFGKCGGQTSLSHGWSAHPTYYLSTQVLGVKLGFPDETDLSKITIAPQANDISWARGTVPHPAGTVEVEWYLKGNKLIVNYTAPKNVPCKVKPEGKLAEKELWVNGRKVTE